jgi:hypothetical protein
MEVMGGLCYVFEDILIPPGIENSTKKYIYSFQGQFGKISDIDLQLCFEFSRKKVSYFKKSLQEK